MSEIKPPVVSGNIGLSDAVDLVQEELAAAAMKYAEKFPPPELWAPGEAEELIAKLAPTEQQLQQQAAEYVACEEQVKDEPANLTDGMEQVRALIVGEFPEAATATHEELEKLYDLWEKQ